jgi:penicillin V acylase-like amidase (Ntn superfamily)
MSGSINHRQVGSLDLRAFGGGSGLHGLPGDMTPPSRFVRAAFFQSTAPRLEKSEHTVVQAFHLLNNFDIIYMCKGGEKNRYPKERLALNYRNILNFHQTLTSGKHITSTELQLRNYWLCNDAYDYLLKLSKDNPIIGRKVFTVSRSVSDCTFHNLTSIDDVHIAEGMCGAQRDIISELDEEMW